MDYSNAYYSAFPVPSLMLLPLALVVCCARGREIVPCSGLQDVVQHTQEVLGIDLRDLHYIAVKGCVEGKEEE